MIKNIIFDFDGVILDSVPVKTEGFKTLFENFPSNKVDQLREYHMQNGGVSRYMKIKYFFEKILNQSITKEDIQSFAQKYSELTKEELSNPKYIINDTLNFIKNNYKKYQMHIASGADENDLKHICDKLDLTKYFLSINGSPMVKSEIVKNILINYKYKKEETILIGDSINDFEAAYINGLVFYGFNNPELKVSHKYINFFKCKIFK